VFVKLPPADRLAIQSFEWGSDGDEAEQDVEPVQSRYFEAWTVEVEGPEGGGDEEWAAPPAQGRLSVEISHSWPACRVGARYAELELSAAGTIYRLKDVTVSSCGGEPAARVVFTYGKLG
jgi:hypothetical protein